jgi:hypothetical protein
MTLEIRHNWHSNLRRWGIFLTDEPLRVKLRVKLTVPLEVLGNPSFAGEPA